MDTRQQPGELKSPVLHPPGQSPVEETGGDHRWLWIAMATLLMLGLAVIFALPALVGPVEDTPVAAESLPQTGESPAQRETAHQALQEYLRLRARLELENAGAWGEPVWSETAAAVSAGDRYFAQRQFAAAAREYEAARNQLQQLGNSRAEKLAASLEAASAALAVDDATTAIAQFEIALAIEPEHPAATRGLARANSRGAVIEQMNLARAAESNSDLEAAGAAYRQALQLDADYVPAQTALQRVTEQVNARDFKAAMSRALVALDAGRTGAAGKALDEAGRLRPGDTAVRDARLRLQGMRTQAGLSSLRRKAAGKVSSEDWPAAVELYRKALAIDPAAGFASAGMQRAKERVKLHAQIDHYLDKPSRVYSAAPLANAEQLLAAAGEAPPDESVLAGKITALRELVACASTPVTVTLNSDGATSILVYRVGRLGQFDTRQLELLPGDYTIVGSRPGFRDVRREIAVRPGLPVPPLVVRCEEPI